MDFAISIVACDYSLAPPIDGLDPIFSRLQNKRISQVPTIQIFGSTPAGQTCLLHVHNVFPYFYVQSPDQMPTAEYLEQLAASIDYALNVFFQKKSGNNEDKTARIRQYVFRIVPVLGIPYYGYYVEEQLFLKIYFFNPQIVKKAAELLQNGAIMQTAFQPFELHVPYILQFFMDYGLYGMDYIYVDQVMFRKDCGTHFVNRNLGVTNVGSPLSSPADAACSGSVQKLKDRLFDLNEISRSQILSEDIKRISMCQLEVDVRECHILNKTRHSKGTGMQNPGLRFIWDDEIHRRRIQGLDESISIPTSQERNDAKSTKSDSHFREQFLNKLKEWQARVPQTSNVSTAPQASSLTAGNASALQTAVLGLQPGDIQHTFTADVSPAVDEELIMQLSQSFHGDGSFPERSFHASQLDEQDQALASLLDDLQTTSRVDDDITSQELSTVVTATVQRRRSAATPVAFMEEQGIVRHEDEQTSGVDVKEGDHHVSDEKETLEMTRHWDSDEDLFDEKEMSDEVVGVQGRPAIRDLAATAHRVSKEDRWQDWPEAYEATPHADVHVDVDDDDCMWPRTNEGPWIDAGGWEQLETPPHVPCWMQPDTCAPNKFKVLMWCEQVRGGSTAYVEPAKDGATTESDDQSDDEIDALIDTSEGADTRPVTPEAGLTARSVSFGIGSSQWSGERHGSNDDLGAGSTIVSVHHEDACGNGAKQRSMKHDSLLDAPKDKRPRLKLHELSGIQGPTPNNSFGFNVSAADLQHAQTKHELYHVTAFSLELHVHTRGDLRPDPQHDPICGAFYAIYYDAHGADALTSGVVWVANAQRSAADSAPLGVDFDSVQLRRMYRGEQNVHVVCSEEALFDSLLAIVRRWDPDILVGYEIQMTSWGFLLERAAQLKVEDYCAKLSRIPEAANLSKYSTEDDWWSMADLHIVGRVVLNLWRIMKHEVALHVYSLENVVFNVLKQRIPAYGTRFLTMSCYNRNLIWRVCTYWRMRVEANIRLLLHCDIIGRTAELAKLFGIQFYEVLSRGSQFRVESMMLRMTRAKNYIAVSPSIRQRNSMAAPQCIPLCMEPESHFYTDPVLVLDFQSLYPSMVIAYNYCYSTCLGKVVHMGASNEFELGCYRYRLPLTLIESLRDKVSFSPAGVAFVTVDIRKGIMPQMLEEILQTRLMVKRAMKQYKTDKALQRVLDARQLGLKLIANVTYGYTSANFSGRMPCVEVADSIVHKGRETLERAIALVRQNARWNAKVVYGDTDSMFVHLAGRTKEEAFTIGEEIAAAVTADNPKPVTLKFEKVYYPCVLQTKKRYVGYSYESRDQKEPVFDAKGIETIRRDTCPAVSKVLEQSLHVLFRTRNVEQVRQYVIRQFDRILAGRVNLRDLVFAKEYRGRESYKATACVPALEIARARVLLDRRGEPRVGERVPYVITCGGPQSTLISTVREPHALTADSTLKVNAQYYVTKQIIPALNRVFNLLGEDTRKWFMEMPRKVRKEWAFGPRNEAPKAHGAQRTLTQFFHTAQCALCEQWAAKDSGLCENCANRPLESSTKLWLQMRAAERRWMTCKKVIAWDYTAHLYVYKVCYNALYMYLCALALPILYGSNRKQYFLHQHRLSNLLQACKAWERNRATQILEKHARQILADDYVLPCRSGR